MANHKSALKRHRQNLKRNARNKSIKAELHTLTKKFLNAPKEEATKLLSLLQSKLDTAARKGVIKRKSAAKKVARAMKNAA
ncbi:MAG: 30S ribosomal protein S20 [Deltaproteobacteria bacterium]|nr:30S ribosomal protein S20 [Deltaproteobacteria bacterium]